MRAIALGVLISAVFSTAYAAILDVDRIVAVVNKDVVLESELERQLRTIRERLREQNTSLPPTDTLRRQVLERIILTRLQLQVAQRSGIRVDDESLNRAIARIAAQNRLSLAQFRDTLEREGYDFAHFREDIRDQMMISRLQQRQVISRIQVSDQEIENFLSRHKAVDSKNKQYRLAHILVAVPEAAAPEQVRSARARAEQVVGELRSGGSFSDTAARVSDGQQAFEGGDLGWRRWGELPTIFTDVVGEMEVGDISDPIRSPSGFHIIQLADVRGDTQGKHVVTQTHARHILVRTNEVTSAEDAHIRLEQLRQRIQGGEDFATLARSHSDDRGSAAKGGDLGWVAPGDVVPQFEEKMNELAPGEVSEPFETDFGWHIIQVLKRRQYDNSAEYAKNLARKQIRERKIEEETQAWLRRLRDEAYVEYRLEDTL